MEFKFWKSLRTIFLLFFFLEGFLNLNDKQYFEFPVLNM